MAQRSRLWLFGQLLKRPLEPTYTSENYNEAVAVLATPFNCYLRGQPADKSNTDIAVLVGKYMTEFGIPFIGQFEQVALLRSLGFDKAFLTQFPTQDGERVESQRLAKFQAERIHALGKGRKVIRVGMPAHLGRVALLDEYFGLNPLVPSDCRTVRYDDDRQRAGAQSWCLDPKTFARYETWVARPGSAAKALLGII